MLRPRIPVNPSPTGITIPHTSGIEPRQEVSPPAAAHHAPATPVTPGRLPVQLTPGSAVALAAAGGAVVLVVGAVLVSMLLAVAITGVSLAVVAVVLRMLVKDLQKGR
ncbi:SpdD-like protein [Streptomyces sp. NPDC048507]|uniref:SpdD-like protein n=1 Tax=Streptomyces sp. NPDC048507 TaxID=3365560 RepID=UPI00371C0711